MNIFRWNIFVPRCYRVLTSSLWGNWKWESPLHKNMCLWMLVGTHLISYLIYNFVRIIFSFIFKISLSICNIFYSSVRAICSAVTQCMKCREYWICAGFCSPLPLEITNGYIIRILTANADCYWPILPNQKPSCTHNETITQKSHTRSRV